MKGEGQETWQLSVLQNQHRVLTEDQHYAITLRRASQLLWSSLCRTSGMF